jgi:hypothetical protein
MRKGVNRMLSCELYFLDSSLGCFGINADVIYFHFLQMNYTNRIVFSMC